MALDYLAGRILGSLRHIIRSIDMENKRICQKYKLTLAQLVCLRLLLNNKEMTSSRLAKQMFVSQATLTGVLDRMESKGLITRERSMTDRRKVFIHLSPQGEELAQEMPLPLQDRFAQSLELLEEHEREQINACLERIVQLMDAPDMEIWPYGSKQELVENVAPENTKTTTEEH